jgi:hypothetical protein
MDREEETCPRSHSGLGHSTHLFQYFSHFPTMTPLYLYGLSLQPFL